MNKIKSALFSGINSTLPFTNSAKLTSNGLADEMAIAHLSLELCGFSTPRSLLKGESPGQRKKAGFISTYRSLPSHIVGIAAGAALLIRIVTGRRAFTIQSQLATAIAFVFGMWLTGDLYPGYNTFQRLCEVDPAKQARRDNPATNSALLMELSGFLKRFREKTSMTFHVWSNRLAARSGPRLAACRLVAVFSRPDSSLNELH